MSGERWSLYNGFTRALVTVRNDGVHERHDQRDTVVPFIPAWPGFAINTLFYAAILWLLIAAPFALRRWRRIKRGLCPACAYPVGTSDLCTECGKPIPLSLRERVRVRAQTS